MKPMNNFIVSNYGFLADITLDEQFKRVFKWVESIREAKRYGGKQAREIIKKNNLNAFVWNPFKEEPILDKWKVVRRDTYTNWIGNKNHNVLEWMAVKVVMQSNTDAKFLTQTTEPELYTEEQAIAIAYERNEFALQELIKKNEELTKSLIKILEAKHKVE